MSFLHEVGMSNNKKRAQELILKPTLIPLFFLNVQCKYQGSGNKILGL